MVRGQRCISRGLPPSLQAPFLSRAAPGAQSLRSNDFTTTEAFEPSLHPSLSRPRGQSIRMDGKSNAIRGRITSVKSTKKITEAMRLVAAAKVGKKGGKEGGRKGGREGGRIGRERYLVSDGKEKRHGGDKRGKTSFDFLIVPSSFPPSLPPSLPPSPPVRRAQEAVLSTRPFNEGLQSVFSGLVQRLALENIELPLLQDRPVKSVTVVCMTGDR